MLSRAGRRICFELTLLFTFLVKKKSENPSGSRTKSFQSPAEIARLITIHFSIKNLLKSSSKPPQGQIHQGSILHLVGQPKRHPDNKPSMSHQSNSGISIARTDQIQYSSISAALQRYRITTPIFDSKTSRVASVAEAPMPHPPRILLNSKHIPISKSKNNILTS
jgi:hypothetical protein